MVPWISKINMFVHGISFSYLFELSDKYFKMSYPIDISITNIIKMFVHGISVSYLFELSDKYFEMSYPMDISITNIVSGISLGISSFNFATAFFAASFTTVMPRSSVAATDSPPDEVCPAQTSTAIGSSRRYCFPPCQSMPDASAASASPCGNLPCLC